jgi:hypothetical protein
MLERIVIMNRFCQGAPYDRVAVRQVTCHSGEYLEAIRFPDAIEAEA